MDLSSFISITGGLVSIAEPVLSWVLNKGKQLKKSNEDFKKVYSAYKEEIKHNWTFLKKIDLAKIDTKDITNPAIKDFSARLLTKAAAKLLASLYTIIQKPEKAVKTLKDKTLTKEEKAEAKKLIKTIITLHENTKELQLFTSLTEAEREILKGFFYARARIKHIQEKPIMYKSKFYEAAVYTMVSGIIFYHQHRLLIKKSTDLPQRIKYQF